MSDEIRDKKAEDYGKKYINHALSLEVEQAFIAGWRAKEQSLPDAVEFAEWILSEHILARDANWFDAGKHLSSKELYEQFKGESPQTKGSTQIEDCQLRIDGKTISETAQGGSDEWISVKDKTPDLVEGEDYSQNCLVIVKGKLRVMAYCWIDCDEDSGYAWCNCGNQIDGDPEFDDDYPVTHWRPLPSPPISEQK